MTAETAPRIDCHAHIYTRDMPLAPDAWHRPPGDASAEQLLADMAAAGVTHGVLAAASLYGDFNDYSLSATRTHPNLKTTVIVPPGILRASLVAMDTAGAVGIRLQLRNKPVPDLGSRTYRQLLDEVAELGWHVQLHDDLERLPPVIAAIEQSGARLVIDHFARPAGMADLDGAAFGAVLEAVARGRTWVKVSAAFRLAPGVADAAFERLLAAGGTQRLIWGSDWPFAAFEGATDYPRAVADHRARPGDPRLLGEIDRTGFEFYFGGETANPSFRMAERDDFPASFE